MLYISSENKLIIVQMNVTKKKIQLELNKWISHDVQIKLTEFIVVAIHWQFVVQFVKYLLSFQLLNPIRTKQIFRYTNSILCLCTCGKRF